MPTQGKSGSSLGDALAPDGTLSSPRVVLTHPLEVLQALIEDKAESNVITAGRIHTAELFRREPQLGFEAEVGRGVVGFPRGPARHKRILSYPNEMGSRRRKSEQEMRRARGLIESICGRHGRLYKRPVAAGEMAKVRAKHGARRGKDGAAQVFNGIWGVEDGIYMLECAGDMLE